MPLYELRGHSLRRIVLAGLFGLLALLVALVAQAPAHLVGSWTGERVKMTGLSGSIWRGQARDMRVITPWGEWSLGQTRWQISRRSLLLLSLGIHLETEFQGQRLNARLFFSPTGKIEVENAVLKAPAALAKIWLPVTVGGDFSVSIPELEIREQSPTSGTALVRWLDASWVARGTPLSLGHYSADLSADEGRVSAVVNTLSGPIEVSGSAGWNDKDYALDLTLSSKDALQMDLRNALMLVASETEEGFRLRYPAPGS